MVNNTIGITNWVPCGQTNASTPNVPCCVSGDYCLTNGLCHYTRSLDGGSGYYAAGCTDKTYKDTTACPQLCDDRAKKDVVYNSSTNLWNCCGEDMATGNANCGDPTDESFDAPAENQLQTYYTAGSTLTSTKPSSASRTATKTPTTSAASSSGLSTGAAAGIGVACGIVGLALIGFLVFFLFRRRRRGLEGDSTPYKHPPVEMATDANVQPPSELASDVYGSAPEDEPKEQEPELPPQELPADTALRREVPPGDAPRLDLPDSLRIRPPRS